MTTETVRRASTIPASAAMRPGVPSSPLATFRSVELALETVSLGVDGACADQSLMLAFETGTEMVASYSLVAQPGVVRDAARTAVEALRDLHVPKDAEVEISCGRYPAPSLVREIKRMSGRANVIANDEWAQLPSFDRAAADIGRQVRGVAAYELTAGWAGFEGPDERRFFLECVIDQVLYWYHRRPSMTPGFKSPIERLATMSSGAGKLLSRS